MENNKLKTDDGSKNLSWWGRLIVLIIFIFLTIPYFTKENHCGLLHLVNLPFHEAGHYILLFWAGEFLCALGGTIGQLIFPIGFAVYFYLKKNTFASLFCCYWISENFYDIGIYMKDAIPQALPLFGGTQHDWNYLFLQMHLIKKSEGIGRLFIFSGLFLMVVFLFFMGYNLVLEKLKRKGEKNE